MGQSSRRRKRSGLEVHGSNYTFISQPGELRKGRDYDGASNPALQILDEANIRLEGAGLGENGGSQPALRTRGWGIPELR